MPVTVPSSPDHRRNIADHRQVLDLAKQSRRLLGRGILHGLFDRRPAVLDFGQPIEQHKGQETGLGPAGLVGFRVVTAGQQLTHMFAQPLRHDLTAADGQQVIDDQVGGGNRQRQQQQHDQDADPAAGEDNVKETFWGQFRRGLGHLRRLCLRPRASAKPGP